MKTKSTFLLVLLCIISTSNIKLHADSVGFQYDDHGNRIKRWIISGASHIKKNADGDQQEGEEEKKSLNERSIKIYPNPTQGDLNVDVTNIKEGDALNATVYDLNGKVLYASPIKEGSNPVNFSNAPGGVYIMRITNGSEHLEYKIIRE